MKKYTGYLKAIGMDSSYPVKDRQCELCGNTEYEVLRNNARVSGEQRAYLPVVACQGCSLIFQLPKFNREFYDKYYKNCYRSLTSGSQLPPEGFLNDQITRGKYLLENLRNWLPQHGALLDVGCSAGGLMVPFKEGGWEVFGVDPDKAYSAYGSETLGVPIDCCNAEDMILQDNKYDLVIINGSLEHVDDPNTVLAQCAKAAKLGSLLLIEGRGLAQAKQINSFGHNHRRYLTLESARYFMQKFGWVSIMETEEEICGPTRPQSIFVLGKFTPNKQREFKVPVVSEHDAKIRIERIKLLLDQNGILP